MIRLKETKPGLSSIPSALLESLRSIGYTLDTALADIIDNSITAKADRISVRFLWNNGKPWIAVCDNGFGMSPKELIEAMRFGSKSPSAKRESDDLGRFGLGMKTVSISQCRHLTVASKKGDTTRQSRIELYLDDGVKVNYLKLGEALAPIAGLAAKEDD